MNEIWYIECLFGSLLKVFGTVKTPVSSDNNLRF